MYLGVCHSGEETVCLGVCHSGVKGPSVWVCVTQVRGSCFWVRVTRVRGSCFWVRVTRVRGPCVWLSLRGEGTVCLGVPPASMCLSECVCTVSLQTHSEEEPALLSGEVRTSL